MNNLPEPNPQEDEDQESINHEQRPTHRPLKKKQHPHHNQGSSAETDGDDHGVEVSSSCTQKAMQESQARKESPSSKKLKLGRSSVSVQKKLAGDKRKASVEDDESRVAKDFASNKIKIGEDLNQTQKLLNPRKPQDESSKSFAVKWGSTRRRSARTIGKLGESGFGIRYDVKHSICDAKSDASDCESGVGTKFAAISKKEAAVEDNVPYSYVCKICRSKFKKYQSLGGHMIVHRERNSVRQARKQALKAPEVGHEGSSVKLGDSGFGAKLPFNDAKNNREAGFGTEFARSRKYDPTGTKEAAVENNRQLPCKFCGREFPNHHALKGHLKVHSNKVVKGKYVCKFCSGEFNSPQDLGCHISMHDHIRREGKQAPIAPEVREARGHEVGETGVGFQGHMSVSGSRRVPVQEAPAAPEVGAVSDHEESESDEDPEAGVEARERHERGIDLNEVPHPFDLNAFPDGDLDGDA